MDDDYVNAYGIITNYYYRIHLVRAVALVPL